MKLERYILAVIIIFLMVAIAQISGQKEIIFPEFVALAIGAWVADKQPWEANKRKIFFLLSFSSLIGVCIVRYLHFPLIFEICTAFIFTAIALSMTRTTLLPIISACILPIYLNITTWVYPLSVTALALVIVYFKWLLEHKRIKPKIKYEPVNVDFKQEAQKWTKLLIIFLLVSLIPVHSKHLYFIAPPLIVTFAELANIESKLRNKPLILLGLLMCASAVGWGIRLFLNYYLHLPLAVCAIFACAILFIAFEKFHTLFPPAGAILLLPMVLTIEDIKFYPLEVTFGSAVFIIAALLLFNKKSKTLPSVLTDSEKTEDENLCAKI